MLSEFEHKELDKLLNQLSSHATIETLDTVECKGKAFPIHGISLGSKNPEAPVFGLFAGVHGLEKIGTQVAISYLKTIATLMDWDETIHALLKHVRIISIPMINPGGMYQTTRCNPRHVDLMRNAPILGKDISPWRLYSGHRLSPLLPWYRGDPENMEKESSALITFVKKNLNQTPLCIAIDVHSGFGLRDRLWFPYAGSHEPFAYLSEVMELKELLDTTYPNHIYKFEPQCEEYTIHGDLWDYLFFEQKKIAPAQVFIPLCLEIGSWNWVKKNPFQLLSAMGPFNPIKQHRRARTLRRHLVLFDFMMRALVSSKKWLTQAKKNLIENEVEALEKWRLKK